MPDAKDFTDATSPTWCPGCGNFGMWEALKRALVRAGLGEARVRVVWGIGCHGNGADFLRRAGLPRAARPRAARRRPALALTRPDLHVIVEMGDGDGYGLGLGHFVHTLRRNLDMTVIAHNNQIYGLTTGQASPTTDHLMRTVSTPERRARAAGQPHRPRARRGRHVRRARLRRRHRRTSPTSTSRRSTHKGFALVDVFQPCVTWNKLNTVAWFRERVYKLEESGWDPTDRSAAFELSMTTFHELTCTPEECRVPIGVFYREEGVPTYEDGVPASAEPGWKRAEAPRDISASHGGLGIALREACLADRGSLLAEVHEPTAVRQRIRADPAVVHAHDHARELDDQLGIELGARARSSSASAWAVVIAAR